MDQATQRERRTVLYSGRVQGVGFRYTARTIAGRYAVDGFVLNLPNGQVELVAEGQRRELNEFLAEVRESFGASIRDEKCDVQAASGEFSGFEIRY